MSSHFLTKRFLEQGTLTDPDGIPDPEFSLPATLNWMRALAILVKDQSIDAATMKGLCAVVTKGTLSDQAVNTVYEQLLMSLHHLAALKAMTTLPNQIDTARSAIVTWYYGIYHAASAMNAAQGGSSQETHAETANAWDRYFAGRPWIPTPYSYRLNTLVRKDVEAAIAALRGSNSHDLNYEPSNALEAFGACLSYLKGSANWRADYIEDDLKRKELKNLGLSDFRTKQARVLRDSRLTGKAFGFAHQAFRYRGKANYREALFISYGSHVSATLGNFQNDMATVLAGFLSMSGSFCAKRIGKDPWNTFYDDLTANTTLSVAPVDVWKKL
jgi:hypothetical protein